MIVSIAYNDRTGEEIELETIKRHLQIEQNQKIPDANFIKLLQDRVEEINKLFEADQKSYATQVKQQSCTHKLENGASAYRYSWHDSHKKYYNCSLCGIEYEL